MTLLDRSASETAEERTDKKKFHLPCFTKRMMYDIFCSDFRRLYPGVDAPIRVHYCNLGKGAWTHQASINKPFHEKEEKGNHDELIGYESLAYN